MATYSPENDADAGLIIGHGTLTISDQLLLLADPLRRQALDVFDEMTGEIDIRTLADRISEQNITDTSSRTTGEIEILLHHHHLPKLASHGIIQYDPATQIISLN